MPNNKLHKDIFAVIDLGSNSFHMLMVRIVGGSVQILGKVKRKVRLASGLDEDNVLSVKAMERGWECLALFAERLQDIPGDNIRIVGTATLRLAKNVDQFTSRAEQILGHPVRVISGEEEAATIYRGAAHTSAVEEGCLVVDIGGASTEVVVGSGFEALKLESLNMGCVTYLERFFGDQKLSRDNFDKAIAAAEQEISAVSQGYLDLGWETSLGASGTVQALQEIMIKQGMDEVITLSRLELLVEQAIACESIDNLEIKGLVEDRKRVFPSGIAILIAIFKQLNVQGMTLSGGALREGLMYSMLHWLGQDNIRQRTLQSVIQRYHIDTQQAQRVAELAEWCANQVKKKWQLDDFEGIQILKAAAMVHETGLLVEFKNHHHHGAYILANSMLPGFSVAQKKLLTGLIHNHREDIDLSKVTSQTTTSIKLAERLTRILRLAVILSMRRKDDALPKVMISVEDDTMSVRLAHGWLNKHPLMRAELDLELEYQRKAGWSLVLDYS